MYRFASFLTGVLSLIPLIKADITWPSANDELEEIMYQVSGTQARLFGVPVIPCSSNAAGPGRFNAAEWVLSAFHDMGTTTILGGARAGGLDASLQFEVSAEENIGPAFNTTLQFMANYLTTRSSLADLIALGVYYSMRSCGGPLIPIRGGRVDAKQAGPPGVPMPQNTAFTFSNQFARMGFNTTEMIQVTACGHSIGGVHSGNFPQIVPPGTAPNGTAQFDSTVAVFDNKIVTEYVAGTTKDPLVVGPSIKATRNSDFKVFSFDGNATVKGMTDPATFNNICGGVLQKMIEVVPAGVVLSDPIQPYTVKPVAMQLTLNSGDPSMQWTGYIRVRTTNLGGNPTSVILNYKDRNGGNDCGSRTCQYTALPKGMGNGFDDTFVWFPFTVYIPTSSGISSFTVTLTLDNGLTSVFDNNGNQYPIQDAILVQKPQSCLQSGNITVVAAVRNDRSSLPVNMYLSYKNTTGNPSAPVPVLFNTTVPMTQQSCVGAYTFYTASYQGLGSLDYQTKIDVISGNDTFAIRDAFKSASDLGTTCQSFQPVPCAATPSSTSSSSPTPSATSAPSSATTTTSPTATAPYHRPTVGQYTFLGCKTEASGARALRGAAFAYNGMTLESCMGNCTGFYYWATEYGRECYCGNAVDPTSQNASLSDCNMACGGDTSEFCGAGDRLELYGSAAPATATLAPKPTVAPYVRVGCYTEQANGRALAGAAYANDSMTLELCAQRCAGYRFWAAEYARECYCGDQLVGSLPANDSGCDMPCAGDQFEYCGGPNRLELYSLTATTTTTTATPTASAA
ncbi:heme peroxidase [Xylariomycetidae sp. FL0641]|nr:heme peroxidase [Xylariomycetidae sp. FL0641]